MAQKFSKSEAILFGWKKTLEHIWFFVGLLIVVLLVNYAPAVFISSLKDTNPVLSGLLSLIAWALQIVVDIGLIHVALLVADGKKTEIADLFSKYHLFLKYLAAAFLFGIIVMIGFLLLIIPGIIWAIKLQFYPYFIVEKDMGPVEALKKSWEATRGSKLNIFLFDLMLGGVVILGAIALGVGLFLAIPTVMIAGAHVYRKLSS